MKARIVTALVLIPLTLAAMFHASPWPLFGLALLATIIASLELGGLLGGAPTRMPVLGVAAMALGGLHLGGAIGGETERFVHANAGLALAGVLAVVALCYGVRSRLIVEASSLWIGAPMMFLVALHHAETASTEAAWHWRAALLLAVVPVWAGDTAGMLAGRAWGRRLLAPKISPKKTVVGAVANALASVAAAGAIGLWLETDALVWALCGASAAVLGQLGDLLESALKRSVGKKDSGALLPGHGGLLDRIDALLLSAPASVLVIVGLTAPK